MNSDYCGTAQANKIFKKNYLKIKCYFSMIRSYLKKKKKLFDQLHTFETSTDMKFLCKPK